jgi:hypothetical protein
LTADVCGVCGTSFAEAMRAGERPSRPEVAPKDALAWSLIFPGLGHRKLGLGVDGFARGTIFVLCFAMAALIGLGGSLSGPLFTVFALYMTMALVVYLGTAVEAYRIAEGGSPFVATRVLLWGLTVLILLSVVLIALAVVGASRR